MSQDAEVLERAIGLACRAHRGQRYPSQEAEPYVHHLLRVMLAVRGFRTQMAAVLHDGLEDTRVTPDQLREAELPDDVVDAVVALTHHPETDLRAVHPAGRRERPRTSGQARRPC